MEEMKPTSLHACNKPGTVHLPYRLHFIFRTKQVLSPVLDLKGEKELA